MLPWVAAVLAVLLALLAVWQRRIDERRREQALAAVRDAKARGATQAVAQYPQIDPLACIGCTSCVRACPEDGVLAMVGGVAHVVMAAKCVGHGLCAEACPVGALTVGLGDLASRPDVPALSEELETSVPGVFIAGELGGIALIRNAVQQGVKALDGVARAAAQRPRPADRGVPDVLIVGSGPSGLAATLRAIELGLRYVTIDQGDPGGTVRKYPRRKLVMTQPVDWPLHGRMKRREYVKEELIALWDEIIATHGVEIRTQVKLLGIAAHGDHFEAQTSQGPIRARFVVLALGRRGTPRRLGVPGEDAEKVLYQLVDAAGYTDRHVLVVGGGDSAIEAATALADQSGNVVTLSYRKDQFFRLKQRNEERIARYVEDGRVDVVFQSEVRQVGDAAVEIEVGGERRTLRNDFVFVFAGGEPPFPLLQRIGVQFGAAEEVAA